MKTCSLDGCDRKYSAKGYCSAHYQRQWKANYVPQPEAEEKRFWAKVQKTDTCWNWTGAKRNEKGYGGFLFRGKGWGAHRVAYTLVRGEITEGMAIDHICHNITCVNPAHLREATNKQNAENLLGAISTSKSGIRGVHWHTRNRRWQATVKHNGVKIHVGYFLTAEEADAAVTRKRNELFTYNDADRAA